MDTRKFAFILGIVVVCFVMTAGVPADAKVPMTCDETWYIDIGYYIDKIEKIFFEGKFAEDHPEAAKVQLFLEKLGLLSFEECTGEFRIGSDGLFYKEVNTLDPARSASFLNRLSEIPDEQLRIGGIINPSSALLSVSVTNPIEIMEAVWDTITDEATLKELTEMMGGSGEIAEAVSGLSMANMMLEGMGGFETFKEVVGSEYDFVVVELPEGDMSKPDYPWDNTVFIFAIAIDDFGKFNELTGGMLDMFFSGEPVYASNGVSYYNFKDGLVIGKGKGFLIVGGGGERLKTILKSNRPQIDPPTVGSYLRVDVNRLWHKHIEPLTRHEAIPYSQFAIAMHKEFWDVTPDTDFGVLEIGVHRAPNKLTSEVSANGEILNLFGLTYTLGMAIAIGAQDGMEAYCPDEAVLVEESETAWMEENSITLLYVIQESLEDYKVDYGVYPRRIEELIEKDYMEVFPLNPFSDYEPMVPRLLTDYAPGDFVYVPEAENDVVVGYHLFLFGAERYSGMDIVSVKNAFPTGHWEEAGDGKPDGIILVLENLYD